MIQSLKKRTGASIRKICAVLEYPSSSYHAAAKPTPTELQDQVLGDESDARTELFAYIDGYYNTRRKHSSLGYISPSQFESKSPNQN